MEKKVWICALIILLVIITSLSVSAIIQNEMIAKETETGAEASLPDHILWNEDLEEYYNGDDFIWNSDTKRYEVRLDNKEMPSVDQVMTIQKWLEENKNSEDSISLALLEFYERQEAYIRANPMLRFKSQVVISDYALDALCDLGYPSMIDMYERIIEEDYMQTYLMYALMDILEISVEVVPTIEERTRWMDSFETKVIEASEATIASAEDVQKYGIFSIARAQEQIVNSSATTIEGDATIMNAVNAMVSEKGIDKEDISAIKAFGEYIKTIHMEK